MRIWRNLIGMVAAPVALLLALPAVAVALPFLAVSAATRGIGRVLDRPSAEWHELIRYEPEIGWKPRSGLDAYHRDLAGDAYRILTDEDGWRGRGVRMAEADVIVVGDSFAFGNAIGEDDFFAHQLSEPRIKTMGAPGYDMVHGLMLMRRNREVLRGKTVVWLLYPGNDLEDNLRPSMDRYRAPFVRECGGDWEIVTEHVSREEWKFPTRRPNFETYVEICRPDTLLSRRAFAACEWLLEQGNAACREVGARLAVVTIPDLSEQVRGQIAGVLDENPRAAERFDPEYADRRIAEICADLRLRFVALSDHLTPDHYRRRDVHWNRRGNRRVAEVLSEIHATLGERGEDRRRRGVEGGMTAERSRAVSS